MTKIFVEKLAKYEHPWKATATTTEDGEQHFLESFSFQITTNHVHEKGIVKNQSSFSKTHFIF